MHEIKLPCKVGDRVKVRCSSWGKVYRDKKNYKTTENGEYVLGEIVCIIIGKQRTFIKIRAAHIEAGKRCYERYPISDLGITVFLI